MDTKADRDQQAAIIADCNTVVAAGAGSGKTRVLTRRFLRLIKEGRATVDQILTLTFTRKAAAEMHERIYLQLLSERDNPFVTKALADFEKSTITTLDSFCSQIIRSGGRALGISSAFSVDEHQLVALAENMGFGFVLEHSGSAALRAFIQTHGLETVWKGFFANLAADCFSLTRVHDYSRDLELQLNVCRKRIREGLPDVSALAAEIQTLSASGKIMERGLKAAEDIARWLLENEAENDPGELASFLEKIKPLLRKSTAKNPDALLYNELQESIVMCIGLLLDASRFMQNEPLYCEFFGLVVSFQQQFLERKQASGILGFGDILPAAISVLVDNPSIRQYFKNKFKAIMIDEFQDNNQMQKDLLFLLAERNDCFSTGIPEVEDLDPEKLFFVGDDKQSIYLFRGADVRVFKALGNQIMQAGGKLLHLATNYRSHPRLIHFYNLLFSKIMTASDASHEAVFLPLSSRASEQLTAENSADSSVEIKIVPYEPEFLDPANLTSMETEALYIAQYIQKAVSGESLRIQRGKESGLVPGYGDFVLLMRSTSNQMYFEKFFRRLGIPYTTSSVRSLFMEAPVNDIYALLQLACVPQDRFACAVYLRSPFVHLPDTFIPFLLSKPGTPFEASALELGLSEQEAMRYQTGQNILRDVRAMIDRKPVREILEYIWYDIGYRYHLLKDPQWHGYLEYIEYLSELARRHDSDKSSMIMFLEEVAGNLGDFKKLDELDVLEDRTDSVRIMSVHASKGLEFPVVILAGAGQIPRDAISVQPYYVSDDYGLCVNLLKSDDGGRINPFYEEDKKLRKQYNFAELKRLLYVALTRAESHLLVTGSCTRNNRNRDDILLNMILDGLGVRDLPEQHPLVEILKPVPIGSLDQKVNANRIGDPLAYGLSLLQREVFLCQMPSGHISVTAIADLHRQIQFEAGRRPRTVRMLPEIAVDVQIKKHGLESAFGTLVHYVSEYSLKGLYFRENLPGHLVQQFPDAIKNEVYEAAEMLAANIPLLQNQGTMYFEEAFVFKLGNFFLQGQIDMFIEEADMVYLYDFKSDREIIDGAHDLQLAIYRKALSLMSGKPVKAFLVYLRDGTIIGIDKEYEDYDCQELEQLAQRCQRTSFSAQTDL